MSPKRRIIPIFIPHLGCPHACVFCDQRRITGSSVSITPQKAAEEIARGVEKSAPAEVAFYGGSFTAIAPEAQEAFLAAAAPFRRTGQVTAIRVSTRPDAIDAATLERLKSWGVETVELGAQSMDDGVLRAACRGHTAGDTAAASARIQAAGLRLILQMMVGLPGAWAGEEAYTARAIAALRPEGVRVYPTVVLRGTELARLWEQGAYQALTVEEAVERCAQVAEIFDSAGIPIIRMGLNPTDTLSSGEVLAGAYHSAFGERVQSRRLREWARGALAALGCAPGARLRLYVPGRLVSAMAGQHRENTDFLRREFSLASLKIYAAGPDTPPPFTAVLEP